MQPRLRARGGTQRRIEGRIGQLLGEAENKGPATVTHELQLIERRGDRADFRLIAKGFGIPLVEAAAKERQKEAGKQHGKGMPPIGCGKLPQPIEPKAKERQKEHGGTAPGKPKNTGGKLPQVIEPKAKTRDIVGAAVGMSGGKKIFRKMKKRA